MITTFYSYGGGVGRTVVTANVAALLARWGHRVLAVDFSVPAPALLGYLDREHRGGGPGLHDLLAEPSAFAGWRKCVARLLVEQDVGADVMAAGSSRPSPLVDWRRLADDETVVASMEDMRDAWRRDYDFVVIDSSSGVSAVAGACTIQLPDTVVAVATTTDASVRGAADVLRRTQRARAMFPYDRHPATVVPLLSKVDVAPDESVSENCPMRCGTPMTPPSRPGQTASH